MSKTFMRRQRAPHVNAEDGARTGQHTVLVHATAVYRTLQISVTIHFPLDKTSHAIHLEQLVH